MRQSHKVLEALALAVLVGCGDGTGEGDRTAAGERDTLSVVNPAGEEPGEAPSCSAAGLEHDESSPPGLPEPVSEMRRAIFEAAAACDYERLEALALEGGTEFTYSFGGNSTPAAYWRELEEGGQDPLAMLVRTLALPYARDTYDVEPTVLFVWPSAYSDEATGFDWLALEGLYSDEEIAIYINEGGFMGWRAGITEDGDWRFFVAGD